ncbi:DNA cytosine methyltransferase [Streptomyces chilikensis]|uniref:DNA cytosine methyltransferase n=1 Tax=Streptomyces chilikensis TaxID=1194079 RepID=UPI000B29A7C1|nr:DNA cytosine methyltransferase [Streptomyces chilikensis]
MRRFTSVDVCSGAGGLALGLEQAGFDPVLALDHRKDPCATLRHNRPGWKVLEMDLEEFDPIDHQECYNVDLLSAGLPRVVSPATQKRTGNGAKERALLRATASLAYGIGSKAIVIDNVPELIRADDYEEIRDSLRAELEHLKYRLHWFVLNAWDFGVPQDRPHGFIVALQEPYADRFQHPKPTVTCHVTAGEALRDSMASRGWTGADEWARNATRPAPTVVGGSEGRGGADVGPTGTKKIWATMGINGNAFADEAPDRDGVQKSDDSGRPLKKLTIDQMAILQAFPPDWAITGKKTARYRQIGHATPPPLGRAVGNAIAQALRG